MRKSLLALLVLTLAGCSGSDPGDLTDPIEDDPMGPVLVDALAAYNAGNLSANVHRLTNATVGSGAEIDAAGDFLFVDSGNVIHILNVSNPLEAVEVSTIDPPGSVEDVKVSDDGNWLFIGDDAEAGG